MPRILGYRIAAISLVVTGFGITAVMHASADSSSPVEPVVPSAAAALAGEPVVVAAPVRARTTTSAPAAQHPASPAAKPAPRPTAAPSQFQVERRIGADGYPWSRAATNAHDTWGFTQRQCVSYVAWRLAASGRPISNAGSRWGSALHWDGAAGGRSSSRPAVGAVAHWNAGESSKAFVDGRAGRFAAGGYGHVGYVTALYPDGSVEVAQYNLRGDRRFSSMRMTAPRYLHLS